MSTRSEHVNERTGVAGNCGDEVEPYAVGGIADGLLLQQLHQVQEELEQYYLKCLDLDSELQTARLANEDARREIQALRIQLQHLQLELLGTRGSPWGGSSTSGMLSRLIPALIWRSGARKKQRELEAQLAIIRASQWFDAAWYLAAYPDVGEAGADPAEHYHEFGWKEARNPGPRFDTAWYLNAYPDVSAAGIDPLWHFIEHGEGEGRSPSGS